VTSGTAPDSLADTPRDVTALVNPFTGRQTSRPEAAAQIAAAVRQQGADVVEAEPASAAVDESIYNLFTPAVTPPEPAPAPLAAAAANLNDAMAVNARSRTRLDSVALATGAYSGKKQPMAMTPEEFVAQVQPYAEQAARHLGVDARVLVAQAALETGWGRHVIHKANGVSSNNLFNIKAGGNWQDQRVSVSTLEYRNGVARQEKAAFRVYDGLQDSFNDYARLISGAERYQGAMDKATSSYQYLREIQAAGYATDPDYADKVWRVFQSPAVQNSTVMAGGSRDASQASVTQPTTQATHQAITQSTSATLLSSNVAMARKG
jgi:flagellar protein FlgJ